MRICNNSLKKSLQVGMPLYFHVAVISRHVLSCLCQGLPIPCIFFRVVYTDDKSDLTVKQVIRSSSGGSDGKVSIRRTD